MSDYYIYTYTWWLKMKYPEWKLWYKVSVTIDLCDAHP